ncbi:transporter mfs1 [Echria macrotheca]|uniref:Transporter mfs1 n=1 Tax=Echria macrotheca TaxID=438768 RepID=A0AAJ0B9X2_9PEZI|nr:transporter mfs1 [Echria macrotheca]
MAPSTTPSSATNSSDCSATGSPSSPTTSDWWQVTWDGPSDPENPKNWSKRRKWATSLIVSGFAFLSPLCSSITAPALSSISAELAIPPGAQQQLVLSVFLLAYALGPLVLSPWSETCGRVPVIRAGNLVFMAFTALCGIASSQGQVTAFRFVAGLGGSASVGMGSGVLTDCWRPEERGQGIAVYQLTQVLGPAVGPIAGGYIAQHASWRWCFFAIVLLSLVAQVMAALFLRETYAPRILAQKARRLRAETGSPAFRTEWECAAENGSGSRGWGFARLTVSAMSRPWIMLATQPIIQVLALVQAFNFGTLYLLISGFPALWEDRYGMPKGDASLNYLSLALGSLVGVSLCGPATDRVYAALRRRHRLPENTPGAPEFRVPLMVPAALLTPCAILAYGWTAQARAHFLLPNMAAALFAGSSIVSYQCISAYVADAYGLHSASASAACALLRSLMAFVFPLFVPALFGNLGYGLGGSLLAGVAGLVGIPAPVIIWFYGERLRRASRLAGPRRAEPRGPKA